MILQARDKDVLAALAKYSVLSTKQIADSFFPGIAHTTVMKRLRILETETLILRCSGLPNAMSAWCLRKNGARLISAEEPLRFLNRNTILHDVMLSELRIALERIGLGDSWTSETELKRQSYSHSRSNQNVPDGIFIAQKDSFGVVALELELHAKSHQRYRKLFREYALKDSIRWLWYVVKNESVAACIFKNWNRVRLFEGSPIMIVSILEEVLLNLENAKIILSDEKTETLGSYFSLLNRNLLKGPQTTQALSKESPLSVGGGRIQNQNEKQSLSSAPDSKSLVPSALDPSPSTLHSGEGSRPTGT